MNITGVTTEHIEMSQHLKVMFWLSSDSAAETKRLHPNNFNLLCDLWPPGMYIFLVFLFFFISSKETREALLNWSRHDDESERFCVVDGNIQSND